MIRSLKKLKEAYDNGTLDAKRDVLMIDNDYCVVHAGGTPEREYEDRVVVAEFGGPHELCREALSLLGIPHEGV